MTLLVAAIIVVALALILLCVRMLLQKDGRFPNTHIEGNKALEKQGIHCANHLIKEEQERLNLRDMMKKGLI